MATQLYEQAIDKTVDWGGDESTNGLPVSGQYVQKFIKDTLDTKFGYLYYDKTALMYYIFADEANYNLWTTDKTTYSSLVLGTFNAPAPATITTYVTSAQQVTVLSTTVGNTIKFKYVVKNSGGNAIAETVTARYSFTAAGSTKTLTSTLNVDFNTYNKVWDDGTEGTEVSQNIDNFLTKGATTTITITLTGNTTQATTTLVYEYNLVEFTLATSFDNTSAVNVNTESFDIGYRTTGGGTYEKYMQVLIDGVDLVQDEGQFSSGSIIGIGNINKAITVQLQNNNGTPKYTIGKHSLQIRVYVQIPNTSGFTKLYSDTLYREFVIADPDDTTNEVYILYSQDITGGENAYFKPTDVITFSTTQYSSTSFNYSIYSNTGSKVLLTFNLYTESKTTDAEGEHITVTTVDTLHSSISSGESDIFQYQFMTYGNIYIKVTNEINDDYILLLINVEKSDIEITETSENLLAKFTALNRANNEPNPAIWSYQRNKSITYNAVFNKVLWNAQSGWYTDENGYTSLKLTNGAQVTIPLNLFDPQQYDGRAITSGCVGTNGVTFEIDFETFDSQDDDAVVMEFKDSRTGAGKRNSYIRITSTSAHIETNTGEGITTNFKDNERVKLAFILNANISTAVYPQCMMIMVNGVLDRVVNLPNNVTLTQLCTWTRENFNTQSSFTIGNPEGAVGVKIYSIRVYYSALTVEQELTNYIADSSDIVTNYQNNDVKSAQSIEGNDMFIPIDFEKCRQKYAVMVLYGDIKALQGTKAKKDNWPFDVMYTDPYYESSNFFLRDAWFSNQGTSSMNYPKRNLRMYMGKVRDSLTQDKTTQYLTEFYPNGYFNVNDPNDFGDGENGSRDKFPFSINKKAVVENAINGIKINGDKYESKFQSVYSSSAVSIAAAGKPLYKLVSATLDSDGVSYSEGGNVNLYIPVLDTELKEIASKNASEVKTQYYIDAYTEIPYLRAVDYRYSNIKIYKKTITVVTLDGVDYEMPVYTQNKKTVDTNTQYYTLGSYWAQRWSERKNAGYTDRWTLKTDYAESSMTHNSGIGTLWGDAMKNVSVNNNYVGRTLSQSKVQHLVLSETALNDLKEGQAVGYFDVRTSCDGKPMVVFVADRTVNEDGSRTYGTPVFLGQFNIMTDKGSTNLFGFDGLKDLSGNTLFKGDKTYCFEGLNNGSLLLCGTSVQYDNENAKGVDDERSIWDTWEARFPDLKTTVETCYLESAFRFINYCKDAVIYEVGKNHISGYDLNPYTKISFETALELMNANENNNVVIPSDASDETIASLMEKYNNSDDPTKNVYFRHWSADLGGYEYLRIGESYDEFIRIPYTDDELAALTDEFKATLSTYKDNDGNIKYIKSQTTKTNYYPLFNSDDLDGYVYPADEKGDTLSDYYSFDNSIDYEDVVKEINTTPMADHVYKGRAAGYDATYRKQTCRELDDNASTNSIEDNQEDYYVDVWLTLEGNNWKYTNEYGNYVVYNSSVSVDKADGYQKDSKGNSYKGKTKMQYFSDKKYDYFDVYKVAAYYIYVMRFCAVDQMVKNTMITTEDAQHWYFINYDNDTVCGVRNDGHLVFNWDCDRNTFDTTMGTNGSYAYAGPASVLWNLLEMDEDFIAIVQSVDNALYNQNLLTYETVIKGLNDKFMNYWCPRLYNAQELKKYIYEFTNNGTTKFLEFLHGTRESHRNWWLRHRFDLYDAKWQTGEFMKNYCEYYVAISDANERNPVDILTIEAASKFYFLCQSNNRTVYDEWYQELKAGERVTYNTRMALAIGDPCALIGIQKVKTLDFRCSKLKLRSSILMTTGSSVDGSTWVDRKGSLLTRLLIGDDSGDLCPLNDLSGVNPITTLEELDIRNCNLLGTTPSIDKLTNLHIYRAEGSSATTFSPAEGCIFYEVSLPNSTTNYSADKVNATTLINMSKCSFVANPNEYIEATSTQKNDKNETLYTINSKGEYVVTEYKKDKAVYYVKYNTEKYPIWKYTPNSELVELSLNEISSDKDTDGNKYFDDYLFVKEWIDNIVKTATESKDSIVSAAKEENPELTGTDDEIFDTQLKITLHTYKLKATNINWDNVPVEFLTNTKTGILALNVTPAKTLTGVLNVIGKGNNGALTLAEYDAIKELYGEDVFNTTSSLRINAAAAMFISSDAKSYVTEKAYDFYDVPAGQHVYTVVRGNNTTFRATIFPSAEGRNVFFQLWLWYTKDGTTNWHRIKYNTDTKSCEDTKYNVTLVTKNNGSICELISNENVKSAIPFKITVSDESQIGDDVESPNYQYYSNLYNTEIYGNIDEISYPDAIKIVGDKTISPTIDNVSNEHIYTIDWVWNNLGSDNEINVDIESITITPSDPTYAKVSKPVINNEDHTITFGITYKMPLAELTENISVSVAFKTASHASITTQNSEVYKVVLKPVSAKTIIIKDNNGNVVENNAIVLTSVGTHDYTIEYGPENYNIALTKLSFTTDNSSRYFTVKYDKNDVSKFSIIVNSNYNETTKVFDSFNSREIQYAIVVTNEYTNEISIPVFNITATISYPNRYKLVRQSYASNAVLGTDYVDANLELTNREGTHYIKNGTLTGITSSTVDCKSVTNNTDRGAGIPYKIDVLPIEAAFDMPITVPYTVEITSITFENNTFDSDALSVKVANRTGQTGGIINIGETVGFYLIVPAIENSDLITKCRVQGSIKFDMDLDEVPGSIPAEIVQIDTTFEIGRSYADYITKADLPAASPVNNKTGIYVVDTRCRYYCIDSWHSYYSNNASKTDFCRPIGVAFKSGSGNDVFGIGLTNIALDGSKGKTSWSTSTIVHTNNYYYGMCSGYQYTKDIFDNIPRENWSSSAQIAYKAWQYLKDNYNITTFESYLPSYYEVYMMVNNSSLLNDNIKSSFGKTLKELTGFETPVVSVGERYWTSMFSNNNTISVFSMINGYSTNMTAGQTVNNQTAQNYARYFINLL